MASNCWLALTLGLVRIIVKEVGVVSWTSSITMVAVLTLVLFPSKRLSPLILILVFSLTQLLHLPIVAGKLVWVKAHCSWPSHQLVSWASIIIIDRRTHSECKLLSRSTTRRVNPIRMSSHNWLYRLHMLVTYSKDVTSPSWRTWTPPPFLFLSITLVLILYMLVKFLLLLLELLQDPQIVLVWWWRFVDRVTRLFVYNLSRQHFPLVIWRDWSLRSLAILGRNRCSWTSADLIWVLLYVLNCQGFGARSITVVLASLSLPILFVLELLGKCLHFRVVSLLDVLEILGKVCWRLFCPFVSSYLGRLINGNTWGIASYVRIWWNECLRASLMRLKNTVLQVIDAFVLMLALYLESTWGICSAVSLAQNVLIVVNFVLQVLLYRFASNIHWWCHLLGQVSLAPLLKVSHREVAWWCNRLVH